LGPSGKRAQQQSKKISTFCVAPRHSKMGGSETKIMHGRKGGEKREFKKKCGGKAEGSNNRQKITAP